MKRFLRRARGLLPASVLYLTMTSSAYADLVITGGSASVASNSVGTVDFYVSSNNPSGDNLAIINNLQLQITTTTGSSTLQFTSSQPDFLSNSNYVFTGNSFDQDLGVTFFNTPTSVNTSNDTISGGDSNDGNTGPGYTTITPGSNFLLATVQFQAALGATPGDSFSIALTSNSNFLDNNSSTVGYTSTAASVIIAAGVPEPSSVILAAFGGVALFYYTANRKKAAVVESATC